MNKSLKTLFLINSVFVFASSLFGPLYAAYVVYLGQGVLAAGLSYGFMLFSSVIAMLVTARYGDKVKEKEYLLAGGYLLRAIAWMGYVWTTNLTGFLLIQIIIGVGEAIGGPAFDAIFANHLNKKIEIREYSEWKITGNLVAATGSVVGGMVAAMFGFKVLFLVMSGLALLVTTYTLTRPKKLL